MFDLESWYELAATLTQNRLRTLLTACGVCWGVFMLIVMQGIGAGLERGTEQSLGGSAARSVFVWPERTSMPYRGLQPGRYPRLRDDDIAALHRIPGVEHVAPRLRLGRYRDGETVSAGAKSATLPVLGDCPELRYAEPFDLKRGRFLNDRDLHDLRKVAVLGEQARTVLFGDADAIGRYVQVRGVRFQVVGELSSSRSGEEGERVRSAIYLPFSTFQAAFNERGEVGWFALTVHAYASPDAVERAVAQTLKQRHGIHPDDPQAIGSFNAAREADRLSDLFGAIRGFVWLVGTVTLLAGVVGVSNIMLITVKERTRELGLRKALGATPRRVVAMIVQEAVTLTAVSGYVGLIAGVAALELLAFVLSRVPDAPLQSPEVDVRSAVAATAILIVSGALAGVAPARHAAAISPVEALRVE